MTELADHELLAEYARTKSEAAFGVLVARYVNLVYSAALRFTGNPHHAEEITQAVFIILAAKAGRLRRGTVLSGWLYQAVRLTSANFVKREIRRQSREQEAYMQSTLNESDVDAWKQIAPLLDEAMGCLGETDRNAIVLRYFENKTAQEIATTLKLNEAAANKRVTRGLEKLRKYFVKRGVTLSAAVIAGAVAANSVQAAPVSLAVTVTAVAVKGAAIGGSTLTLIKGALKLMVWSKAQTVSVATVCVLLAVTITTMTVIEIQAHESFRIVPGQSVGKVQKGMTAEQVEAVLGKPEEVRVPGCMVYEKRFGFSVICESNKGVTSVLCRSSLPQYPRVKDFKGATKEGIGMKSSRADIVKAYGEPTSSTHLDGGYESLVYNLLGLNFVLSNGKVYDFSVSFLPPNTTKPITDGLSSRHYRLDPEIFVTNLRRLEGAGTNESIQRLTLRYFKENGFQTNDQMHIFWSDELKQLFVRCKPTDQDKIELLVEKLNSNN